MLALRIGAVNAVTKVMLKRLSRAARPYLKSSGLLQLSAVYNRSALLWEPAGENVVVLAPHMDDEIIGCGGTLALHAQRGARLTVVFLTDGRNGSGELVSVGGEARVRLQRELVETREREARCALQMLGIEDAVFLGAEDGTLRTCEWIAARLRPILIERRPDLVYLPFFLEEHADHRAVSRILLDAVGAADIRFQCMGYEVWTPLFPNCLVRIDEVMARKKEALAQYESQLVEADYIHASVGLNAHRSIGLRGSRAGYAEAFYASSLRDFREQYKRYCMAE